MSESASSADFLFGLEEYLIYLNKEDITARKIHAFAKVLQNKTDSVTVVRTFLQYMLPELPETFRPLSDLCHQINKVEGVTIDVYKPLLTYLAKMLVEKDQSSLGISIGQLLKSINDGNFEEFIIKDILIELDRQYPNDKIFRGIMTYFKLKFDPIPLRDSLSRSQIRSKIWLVEELSKIGLCYSNVLIMAGWFGQLKTLYDKRLTYKKMRIVELDKQACNISDYVFNLSNLENYKVKSVNADITTLSLHKNGYEWEVENFKEGTVYTEKFLPDLIINTSAEHMTEEWYHQIRFKGMESSPVVVIQSNNLFDLPEHVNCVHSIEHMKKKFPMSEILFEGELQLKGYKRVMLIGRP